MIPPLTSRGSLQTEWGIPITRLKIYAEVRDVRIRTVLGFGGGGDVTSDCI